MLSKAELKRIKREEQGGRCAISGLPLPEDIALFDLDRIIPGNEGGKYTAENTRAVLPQAHRDHHINTPNGQWPELRQLMREYRVWVKQRNQIANSQMAAERCMSEMSGVTRGGFDRLLGQAEEHVQYFKKEAQRKVKAIKPSVPIVAALLAQRGVGEIYVAEIITTLDIRKAEHPSSFWAYTGWAGASRDRYQKGVKGGGNKHFRSVMFNLNMNLIKNKNPHYAPLYYQRREKTGASDALVFHKGKLNNGKSTSGREVAWRDVNPGRRHLDALRWMGKQFLADLWRVWRTLEGLPLAPLYAAEHLGKHDIIDPHERGWEY